jgi:hypothetical protein
MSDQIQKNAPGELNSATPITLGDALRALPQLAPEQTTWAEMAARLAREPKIVNQQPPRRSRRYVWPIGIAAALVLGFSATTVLRMQSAQRAPLDVATDTAATESGSGASSVHNAANSTNSHESPSTPTASLAYLQTRSRALELWLRETSAASAPQSAQDLAASAEIEDMIGLVDVQLGAVDADDSNATLPLWRRRVALLEDLSTLRYSANALSLHNGIAANAAPANEVNAAPAVWRN